MTERRSSDVVDRLVWDDESLIRHGVRPSLVKCVRRAYVDGGAKWVVSAHLRRVDDQGPAPQLGLRVELLDSRQVMLETDFAAGRPGRGRSKGAAIVSTAVAIYDDDETEEVESIRASVHSAPPHYCEEPLELPVTANNKEFSSVGASLELATAKVYGSEYSAQIAVDVALRVKWASTEAALVVIHAVNAAGLPVQDHTLSLTLHEDPEHLGTRVGATTLRLGEPAERVFVTLGTSSDVIREDIYVGGVEEV